VRWAGGWLCDRAMAGWDVTVLTARPAELRPLRILGARAAGLEPVLAAPVRGPLPQAMAVAAELYGSDPRVRALVHDALAGGVADVRLWGDLDGGVPHRLSVAARAFKTQALAAVAADDVTEVFGRGELVSP
jgi:hypothetical protein